MASRTTPPAAKATEPARLALLAAIVQSSDDAIISKTLDGVITSWNPAAERMYGYRANEIMDQPISMLIPADKASEMTDILRRISDGLEVEHYETVRLRKNGTHIPVSLTVSPVHDGQGRVVGASSIARDITERVRIEEQIQAASQYARSLIEASLDPLVTISPEGKITDVNEATAKVTGLGRESLIGTDFSDYFTEPDKARDGYQQVFAQGSVTDYPLTIRHRDGHLTDVLYNASVYKDSRGNVLGVFAAARDVTEQKQASQYARSLIEASLDPLVTISPEGKITDVNEATAKVTGLGRESLIGTDFSDYFTEPDKAREGYQQVFAQGSVTDYPLTIRHRDGQLTDVLYNASVYKDSRGNVLGVFAAARDVTAQKRAENQIADQRSKELERLAELERFQRLTVGRELKMIELKKEISELKRLVPDARMAV
jgi:PAS domain S-box-containing protein